MHRRFGAVTHALRYRMFMALLDLDEIASLDRRLWLFSHNRFNLFSFYDADHGGTGASLREEIDKHLNAAGIAIPGGAVKLLSLPRILGFAFNPLSIAFCSDASGSLVALLYEVRNTFGQRHTYLIPVEPGTGVGPIHQECRKNFYVSPFMDMDMTYRFRIAAPGASVTIAIDGRKGDERVIGAWFAGRRKPLTDRGILGAFLRYPLLSLVVVAGIHWEALKLWVKGMKLRVRPSPPAQPVSIVTRKEI